MVENHSTLSFPFTVNTLPMTTFIALKRVLAHFKAILAQRPLRIILRILNVCIRVWKTGFGYRKTPPDAQAMWKPESRSTLGESSYLPINIIASRIPSDFMPFSREQPTGSHETELLPLPVTTSRPLRGHLGGVSSMSDSLAKTSTGITRPPSHASMDHTPINHPHLQFSVDGRSWSAPNLSPDTPEPCTGLTKDSVPVSHILSVPPLPSNPRSQSCNDLPDFVPVTFVTPQGGNTGDCTSPNNSLHPDNEASRHDTDDSEDASAGYYTPDTDLADPCSSQHWNSPALVSWIQHITGT
jgi:hypothetical protein